MHIVSCSFAFYCMIVCIRVVWNNWLVYVLCLYESAAFLQGKTV